MCSEAIHFKMGLVKCSFGSLRQSGAAGSMPLMELQQLNIIMDID